MGERQWRQRGEGQEEWKGQRRRPTGCASEQGQVQERRIASEAERSSEAWRQTQKRRPSAGQKRRQKQQPSFGQREGKARSMGRERPSRQEQLP